MDLCADKVLSSFRAHQIQLVEWESQLWEEIIGNKRVRIPRQFQRDFLSVDIDEAILRLAWKKRDNHSSNRILL